MEQGKINKILTLIFMVLAVASVILYFTVDDKTIFWYCGGAAVCIRLTQYLMKFIM